MTSQSENDLCENCRLFHPQILRTYAQEAADGGARHRLCFWTTALSSNPSGTGAAAQERIPSMGLLTSSYSSNDSVDAKIPCISPHVQRGQPIWQPSRVQEWNAMDSLHGHLPHHLLRVHDCPASLSADGIHSASEAGATAGKRCPRCICCSSLLSLGEISRHTAQHMRMH